MKIKIVHFAFLFLISLGYSQDKMDIFDVARKGTLEQAKEILKTNPKATLALNADGNSALLLAVYKNNNQVAQFLIDNGADVNGNTKMGTPLMAAVVKGNIEAVKMLLDKKADVNIADANGMSALIYAVTFKNYEIVSQLIKVGANAEKKDSRNNSAIDYAILANDDKLMELLKNKNKKL